MKHKESELQISCVRWFSYQYPQYRMLLYHPRNEGSASGRKARTQQAIAKAEGVVAGVADLILQIPTPYSSCLAIEMKTPTGKQSKEQKLFELYIHAARGRYVVCRSIGDFQNIIRTYLSAVNKDIASAISATYRGQQQAEQDKAREQLRKIIAANK